MRRRFPRDWSISLRGDARDDIDLRKAYVVAEVRVTGPKGETPTYLPPARVNHESRGRPERGLRPKGLEIGRKTGYSVLPARVGYGVGPNRSRKHAA